jgi:DNA (cytosine-5)-methyltransferase 1
MKPRAYYSENDPFAAEWLRMLITFGYIPNGYVDTRSIEDVKPNDLAEFNQWHFFAGIGGWPLALRLTGWPDSRSVATGSCPCQPFSTAGKGSGFNDERHLWPAFFHLISQREFPTIFGEQVASKDGLAWIDLVQADLEASGYSFGVADLSAASIGAPHIRQRLYFRANSYHSRYERCGQKEIFRNGDIAESFSSSNGSCSISNRCDSIATGLQGYCGNERNWNKPGWLSEDETRSIAAAGSTRGFWSNAEWWHGRDEKYRPIEPGLFPLAHGVSGRVGKLRGYGNAIVPELAAEFIQASEEALELAGRHRSS